MSVNPTQKEVDAKIDETLDKSVDATRRILQTAHQTEEIGAETSAKLVEQGEKLDRIEGKQQKIEQSVVKNKAQLSALEKCCGVFRDKKKLNQMNEETYRKSDDTSKFSPKSKQDNTNENTKSNINAPSVKITDDAREDEIDQNLAAVSGIVGNLKSLAIGMGNELDKQNEQLDRINEQTQKNNMDIDNLDRRTRKLLNENVDDSAPVGSKLNAAKVAKSMM